MPESDKLWIGRKLESSSIYLKAVGALTTSTVRTLVVECHRWNSEGKAISVELSEVTAFDRVAADALVALVNDEGVKLRDPPQHVVLLLNQRGLAL